MIPIFPPEDNSLLCSDVGEEVKKELDPNAIKYAMIVPRGTCTFERKALNAQRLGASSIIIYGSLGAMYSVNETLVHEGVSDPLKYTIWPADKHDYECDNGESKVPISSVSLPYNSRKDDPIFSGIASDGNECAINDSQFTETCASERCLLTGEIVGGSYLQACCAWDLHVWLYSDPYFVNAEVSVQAVFITMKQAAELLNAIYADKQNARVTLYRRPTSNSHISSIVIVLMGVAVATCGAYMSSSEYRNVHCDHLERNKPSSSSRRNLSPSPAQNSPVADNQEDERLDVTMGMACGFVVISSLTLILLFYLKIYGIVKAFYAFGCASAIMQVLVLPLVLYLARITGSKSYWDSTYVSIPFEGGPLSRAEFFSLLASYAWCSYWLYLAFSLRHPSDESTFFWISQDIMGASMCILFVTLIRVPNLSIASVLLWALFFYDIFFVFIS